MFVFKSVKNLHRVCFSLHFPPTNTKEITLAYKCDPDKLVCYPDKDGPSKPICEETCGKPRNVTPAVLTGVWRGFEINADYHKGEWDMRVDEKTGALIIMRPDNTMYFH